MDLKKAYKNIQYNKKRMKIIDMEKKGWATGQDQGKLPRRDSLDGIPTRTLSTG